MTKLKFTGILLSVNAVLLIPHLASCTLFHRESAPAFQETVQSAKAKVYPALVYIRAIQSDLTDGKTDAAAVGGSGVLISPDGELLTNHHVISKATEIRCLLNDGSSWHAEIIGSDKDLDIALLKLKRPADAPPLPYAKLSTEHLVEGDFVMAMGAPMGLPKTVTIGIVSCTNRVIPGAGKYTTWYQTDAAILPGNSGGPLVNTKGGVVGLNTLGMKDIGVMGFTLPSTIIADVLPRLRQYKKVNWAWFGLQLQPLHDFDRDIYFNFKDGVMVSGTDPGSPARLAGIQPNDRILSCGGQPVTAMNSEDIPAILRKFGLLPFGTPVEFEIERGGVKQTVSMTPKEKGAVEGSETVFQRWGFSAKAINRFDTPMLHFYAPNGGVFIYGINDNGNAAKSELRRNDIIVSVDGVNVSSLDELDAAYQKCMDAIESKTRAGFVVLRGGRRVQIVLNYFNDYDKE